MKSLSIRFRPALFAAITLAIASGCGIFRETGDLDENDAGVAADSGTSDIGVSDAAEPGSDADGTADIGENEDVGETEDMQEVDVGADVGTGGLPGCQAAPTAPQPGVFVGDGTAASCDEAAFKQALLDGRPIGFDCDGPVTIPITGEITIERDTVIVGNGEVTFDGGSSNAIFRIDVDLSNTSPHLQLFGVTITNGYKNVTVNTEDCGAAVYRYGGTLTIVDSVITNNGCTAGPNANPFGGAIVAIRGGGLFVYDSVISKNSANGGGGVYTSNSPVDIVRTEVTANSALAFAGGGLGLFEQGPIEICGSLVRDNNAEQWGGGLFFDDDNEPATTVTISQSSFADNTAGSDGGGADIEDTVLRIEYSTFSGNSAPNGGGLWMLRNDVEIESTSFLENAASAAGGGIYQDSVTGSIRNGTFHGNRAGIQSDGAAIGHFVGGAFDVDNTVFALNQGASTCSFEFSGANNFQYPAETLKCGDVQEVDPRLTEIESVGGGMFVSRPASDSPLIGAGAACGAIDQIGQPRPDNCTVGAVEGAQN